mmetsp:Transcript_2995/g.8357  ORF Transcript_2995/g.8357 Transcript_2995/m.8357 type:complete len:341 (-) Transcript_2995:1328-2350(-)
MLLTLHEMGAIKTQKRVDYAPLCAAIYAAPSQDKGSAEENLVVGSQVGVAYIYHDMQLLWSTRLAWPAAAIRISSFGAYQGFLLTLAYCGTVTISFLGTDPPTVAVASEVKELNYEAMDDEHRRLLQIIRDASSDHKVEPVDGITLRAQVPQLSDRASEDDPAVASTVVARIFVSYTGSATLDMVTLVRGCCCGSSATPQNPPMMPLRAITGQAADLKLLAAPCRWLLAPLRYFSVQTPWFCPLWPVATAPPPSFRSRSGPERMSCLSASLPPSSPPTQHQRANHVARVVTCDFLSRWLPGRYRPSSYQRTRSHWTRITLHHHWRHCSRISLPSKQISRN